MNVMTWLSVLAAVLKLLGPVLVKWLEKLLDDAARELSREVAYTDAGTYGLETLFDRARRKVRWFQFRKRAAISLAERAVIARADDIEFASLDTVRAVRPLTNDERIALRAALAD